MSATVLKLVREDVCFNGTNYEFDWLNEEK